MCFFAWPLVVSNGSKTPEGWERGETQISGRRKIIVYTSPNDPSANAFVAYTPVRGDFTSLGMYVVAEPLSRSELFFYISN